MPHGDYTRTDVSASCMIFSVSTIALEKEITLEAEELGPRVPLDDNVAIEIQGPFQRLETEPAKQVHLDAIPNLEFIGTKGGQANLALPFYSRVLVANTRNVLAPKKDIRILVTANDTESQWDFCLLEPLPQIQRIIFISARRHCPHNTLLMNERLNIHLFVHEISISDYRRVHRLGNSCGS